MYRRWIVAAAALWLAVPVIIEDHFKQLMFDGNDGAGRW